MLYYIFSNLFCCSTPTKESYKNFWPVTSDGVSLLFVSENAADENPINAISIIK